MKLGFNKWIFLIISLFSLTGLVASFILSVEYTVLLKDSGSSLSCDISTIISCSSVMKSEISQLFGFPNPFIGLVAYSIFLAFGVLMFLNPNFPKIIKFSALLGSLGAFLFSYWLLFMSVFKLHSICPYCVISCISATNIFFAMLIYSFRENLFNLNPSTNEKINYLIGKTWYLPIIAIWYMGVTLVAIYKLSEF